MRDKRRRGSLLVYVAWIVVFLALFVVGIGSQALATLSLSERLFDQLRAAYLVRGAVPIAMQALGSNPTSSVDGLSDAWANNPTLFQDHALAGGSFSITSGSSDRGQPRYGLQDEE